MGFKVLGETGHFYYLGNGTFHALGEGTLYFLGFGPLILWESGIWGMRYNPLTLNYDLSFHKAFALFDDKLCKHLWCVVSKILVFKSFLFTKHRGAEPRFQQTNCKAL